VHLCAAWQQTRIRRLDSAGKPMKLNLVPSVTRLLPWLQSECGWLCRR
jgi:hypothetical protein